jgi:hypothetical protein
LTDGVAGTDRTDWPAAFKSVAPILTFGRYFESSRAYEVEGPVFGVFAISVEPGVSLANMKTQIAAIARRVLADQPKAVINGKEGTALTYTRTGSMFCSRDDNTGSIIPANRPCIARGGILVEGAATNLILRSQELSTSPWIVDGATVTNDYAIAPDGTKTAERLACPGGGSACRVVQPSIGAAGANTTSVYVKGTSGSGALYVYANVGNATACAFNSTTWTRCSETKTFSGASAINIGFEPGSYGIPASYTAVDVLIWGAQVETGSVATSYTPTTSAAATRGASLASYTFTPTRFDQGCIGTSIIAPPRIGNTGIISLEDGTTFKQSLIDFGGLRMYVGGSSAAGPTGFTFSGSPQRFIGRWSPSLATHEIDGVAVSGSVGVGANWTNIKIGNYSGAQAQPGWYSRIQYDPRPTRCR